MQDNFKEQIFSRQIKIEDWKQSKLQQQVALILGVGGIGSITFINLLRLGIKKVFIIDYDIVEIHNINRQLIYSLNDVGRTKIEAAKNNSQFFNVGATEVFEFNLDALKNWQKIVELAKQSNVVFNCIDHGDHWDAAVQSLCLSLNIPHLIGGSFAQSFMAEIYCKTACYACLDDNLQPDIIKQITPDKIQNLENVEFLPKNEKPVGQSHIALCSTCGNFVTQLFVNFVNEIENSAITKKVLFYMTTFEVVQFPIERNRKCLLCSQEEEKSNDKISETFIQQEQDVQQSQNQ